MNTSYQYWIFQIFGWSLASLYWAYAVYVNDDYSVLQTIVNFFFDVLIGISLTHVYRRIIKKSKPISFDIRSVIKLIVTIFVLSILFMVLVNLKWYFFATIIRDGNPALITALFFWDPPLITGLRLMSIWVLTYHLYHYYWQQLTLTKRNAELSLLSKQMQIDHLSEQLNPHFLFNSLNSVKSLISEDPTKAKRSIDLLSGLLRSSLYSNGNLTTIESELQLTVDYIALEKLRFEERLQLKMNIDDDVLRYKIPILSIQTLIENALKHGIQNSIKGGRIALKIFKKTDHIKIVVQNPGRLEATEEKQSSGLGLNSLKKRLQLHYPNKSSFKLIEEPEGLVTATIIVPFNE